MTYENQIMTGAALLDKRRPGWENRIDLDSLDMFSKESCIIGQVCGAFSGGWMALQTERGRSPIASTPSPLSMMIANTEFYDEATDHGFYLGESYDGTLSPHEEDDLLARYRTLTDEWREFIRARREAKREPVPESEPTRWITASKVRVTELASA